MKKYTAKDEAELVKQIESDTELDKELEKAELIKGNVVEIRYAGKRVGARGVKKPKAIPA